MINPENIGVGQIWMSCNKLRAGRPAREKELYSWPISTTTFDLPVTTISPVTHITSNSYIARFYRIPANTYVYHISYHQAGIIAEMGILLFSSCSGKANPLPAFESKKKGLISPNGPKIKN